MFYHSRAVLTLRPDSRAMPVPCAVVDLSSLRVSLQVTAECFVHALPKVRVAKTIIERNAPLFPARGERDTTHTQWQRALSVKTV